jgi:hypothetical protein
MSSSDDHIKSNDVISVEQRSSDLSLGDSTAEMEKIIPKEKVEDSTLFKDLDNIRLKQEELKVKEYTQKLDFREEIVSKLIRPVIYFPYLLMMLLLAPIIIKILNASENPFLHGLTYPYAEDTQKAIILALSVNFTGLFYIIVRDLFPSGKESKSETDKK